MSLEDIEEAYYLALNAIDNKNHEAAIRLLKQIETGPYEDNARFLLGAEYAEIGMYQRAAECFESVLEKKPELTIARFQKGLVHLKLGDDKSAKNEFELIDSKENSDYLIEYSLGLQALIDQDIEKFLSFVDNGNRLNKENEALKKNMTSLYEKVKGQGAGDNFATENTQEKDEDSDLEASKKFLLSKYVN